MQPRLSGGQTDDRHARARGLCQVSVSDAKRVIYDARASWGLRADGMRARWDGKGDRHAGSRTTILSPRHRDLRDTIREGEKERRNMIRRKTAVAVLIAVIVGAAFAAYTLRPKATNSSVAVNEPNTDTGNPGTGTGTTPSTPPTPPAKASQGPKHGMCVHENDHIPDQARVHGANWYRFYDRAACTALESLADFVSIF